MNVRYRVELSQAERTELTALVRGGKHAASCSVVRAIVGFQEQKRMTFMSPSHAHRSRVPQGWVQ
jgi:hypothetical protein